MYGMNGPLYLLKLHAKVVLERKGQILLDADLNQEGVWHVDGLRRLADSYVARARAATSNEPIDI